jgi:acetolactate synthase-1/2/3 large subunit
MRIFESLVAGLENVGVTAGFGGAGETCTGMILALKHSTQIRGIITRHEQAASLMACGFDRGIIERIEERMHRADKP